MNHELTVLENLSGLILSGTMDRYLTAVNARSDIITYIAVTINRQSIRSRTQPASDEPVTPQIVEENILPAFTVRVDYESSHTLVTLYRKLKSVNDQCLRFETRMNQPRSVPPIQPIIQIVIRRWNCGEYIVQGFMVRLNLSEASSSFPFSPSLTVNRNAPPSV